MKRMEISHFMVGPVMTNCYFIINKETKELLVVDPGGNGKELAKITKEEGFHPVAILLTHGHYDHVGGIKEFRAAFPEESIPIYAHNEEKQTLENPDMNLSGGIGGAKEKYGADVFVRGDETISLAGFEIQVLFTPGHTPGGCCYYFPEEKALFSGDTLFAGSVGRTDYPGGSMGTLIRSIKEKCLTLPDDTVVLPGHEGVTNIETEKKYNPFL